MQNGSRPAVIPGRCESIEPGISRFPDAQLRICGLVLTHHPGMTTEDKIMHKPVETFGSAIPQNQSSPLRLSRFKVIDLTLARAGPSCVRTLADWGADVIRVEPPPDDTEASELVGRRDGSDFQNLHRNKRAITLHPQTH